MSLNDIEDVEEKLAEDLEVPKEDALELFDALAKNGFGELTIWDASEAEREELTETFEAVGYETDGFLEFK